MNKKIWIWILIILFFIGLMSNSLIGGSLAFVGIIALISKIGIVGLCIIGVICVLLKK